MTMPIHLRSRLLAACSTLCFGAVAVALVSQHAFGMQPCAWCVLQRVAYLVAGLVCLVGALQGGLARAAAGLGLVLTSAGAAAAWFQHTVASHLASCDRTFADRVISQSGLDDMLPPVFGIYASCMDARAPLFGVEYALWSLVVFVVLTAALVIAAGAPAHKR